MFKVPKKEKKLLWLSKILLMSVFILSLVGLNYGFVEGEESMEEKCRVLAEKGCQNLSSSECRKVLEDCEEYYRKESEKIEADISKTEKEKETLQNKIYTLNQKVKNLSYQINQSNLVIKDLKIQVGDTLNSIEKTSLKIEESKGNLANILRTIYEEDQKPLIEILFSENELSDFFDDLVALEILNSKNKDLLQNIKILKSNLEEQNISLDEEKDGLERTVKLQLLQKEESDKTKKDQEYYLNITEQEYQTQLQDKREIDKKAAEIRTRIFQLVGVADVDAPTFGQALELAKWVQQMTGVRVAFLLSIITQESALGRNVGRCYIADTTSGASVGINTGKRFTNGIHPTRDLPKLIQITQELGRDPLKTPVSCPLSYGYGGAMGPAQFIPSTWILIKSQAASILGTSPNPWSIKDSFLAAGVLLRENGAATSEVRAAARYFGQAGLGYESAVMRRTACIQTFIDDGTLTSSCERLVFIP